MSAKRPVTPTAVPPARELGDRPAISHPDALSPSALADAVAGQPRRGLIGLLFVIPLAVLLAIGANGAVHSLLVLGPIITFALPVLAMIAFWWEDWPGVMFPRQWSGLYDTVIVVAGGVVLTVAGQFVVNGPELIGVFAPGPAHIGTYPATVHLCGCIFTIMLQLTLVCERRPLDRFGRIPSGLVALALSWALGLAAWLVVVRSLGIPGVEYAAFFVSIGLWQMIFYTAVRGWPFARIARRGTRLLVANVTVIACGWATYRLASALLGWPGGRITAVAGTGISCILVVALLFEWWPAIRVTGNLAVSRTISLSIAATLAVLLAWSLPLLARALGVPPEHEWGWLGHVTLNALSTAVLLHVAVWRRWPARAEI